MANTLNLGDGNWATKEDSLLGYNSENNNYKPLPFDFSRASSATRVNKDGLIETVGAGEPRIDFKGNTKGALLLEPQRSNLITYSEAISNTIIKKGTFADNFAISPDGKQNATKLTATNTDPYFYQNLSFSAASYTASIYVKGIGNSIGKKFQIRIANNFYTYVIPSEWTRFECTATLTSGTANVGIEIPNPAVVGDEVLVWGWQLEQGSYATSYIPTNGSQVTRSAETCNNAGNSSVFNSEEGVLYAEISALANDGTNRWINLGDGINGELGVTLRYITNENLIVFAYYNGTTFSCILSYTLSSSTNFSKIVAKYKENDFALWVDGFKVGTDNNGSVLSPNTLSKLNFDNGVGGNDFYGNIKQIQYFDKALTDQELIALTS